MQSQYDVVVAGGGTAGVVAAVQAGRAGARTLLIEKNGILGGTITVGGINAPAHFFAWGRPVIAGIGWELFRRTRELCGEPIPTPEFTLNNDKPGHLTLDKAVYAAVCDEAVLAAGVDLVFHAMSAAAVFEEGAWTLTVCTKTGLRKIRTRTLIDATGDANVVSLAGFPLVHSPVVQPATLSLYGSGYDVQQLDFPALNAAAEAAVAAGELKSTDLSWRNTGPESFLKSHGVNANHIRAPGADTSEGRTAVEVESRRAMLRVYRFFKKQPGLEKYRIDWFCTEAGIRETVTIQGKETVTVQAYESGFFFDSALCYAYYNIDEHLNDGKGINYRRLGLNVLPTIPRGALLPAGSRFLLVAGRCVASDREANAALRVECPCMAMGQAAGALAALSARMGLDPEELPLEPVRALLRQHGAIVPERLTGA